MMSERIGVVFESRPIIVGSGIAGLATALSLDGALVVTAGTIGKGSSWLAQGGMAAAMSPNDDRVTHALDTIRVGGGITDAEVAQLVTSEAPGRIDWLVRIGADFDTDARGDLVLGREAGHSHRRIVHAGGDATGAEIMRALRLAALVRNDIELVSDTLLVDLIRSGDSIVGALTMSNTGSITALIGPAVVLATGGIGGVYARSTNPADVTGSGLAAAARQGARLADLEFVQFHPTALAATDHPAPLVSEALRGEGAILVDEAGRRFMIDAHPHAELAPRDVVSRAIWGELQRGHRVFLDATSSIGNDLPVRFPTAFEAGMEHGIDGRYEPLEVAPAEHFHMGGIATDTDGRSSLDGLWAAGEVASTGLHGANRLASNSLLEGAVMGQRVARSIIAADREAVEGGYLVPGDGILRVPRGGLAVDARVRDLAWEHLGIVRSARGLEYAHEVLTEIREDGSDAALVAALIAEAALARTESRGAHYRVDHPQPSPEMDHRSFVTPSPVPMKGLDRRAVLAS